MALHLELEVAYGPGLRGIGTRGDEAFELEDRVEPIAQLQVVAAQGFGERQRLERAAETEQPGEIPVEPAQTFVWPLAREPVVGGEGPEREQLRQEVAASKGSDHPVVGKGARREWDDHQCSADLDGIAVTGKDVDVTAALEAECGKRFRWAAPGQGRSHEPQHHQGGDKRDGDRVHVPVLVGLAHDGDRVGRCHARVEHLHQAGKVAVGSAEVGDQHVLDELVG